MQYQKDPTRSGRFLRETFEAVREDKKGRRPQSDKDAKSFTVCLGVDRLTPCEKPDGNGADNGGETEDEAEFAEKFETTRTRLKIPKIVFVELAKNPVVGGFGNPFGAVCSAPMVSVTHNMGRLDS